MWDGGEARTLAPRRLQLVPIAPGVAAESVRVSKFIPTVGRCVVMAFDESPLKCSSKVDLPAASKPATKTQGPVGGDETELPI